jgi:hypothetical protein
MTTGKGKATTEPTRGEYVSSTHIAFGLRWSSDIDLPEFPKAETTALPDIRVSAKTWPSDLNTSTDHVSWYKSPDRSDGSRLEVFLLSEGEFFLVRYGDGTEFLINRTGSQVWCRWDSKFPWEYVTTYLYGPISGFLLRLRGSVCLHASVIGIDRWAVAFVGSAGAGKSTLAAAMAGRGFRVLSDDILALTESNAAFRAVPAYPRIRLWPESVSALMGSPDALPRITAGWEKRHLALTADRFESHDRPLGVVYLLGERNDECLGPRIEARKGTWVLRSLIANTYAYKTFDREMRAYEFDLLSRLAGQVPVRSVTPFSDTRRIQQLCDLILKDFQKLQDSPSASDSAVQAYV